MIFRSGLEAHPSHGPSQPAFDAIARVQHGAELSAWFIPQPDHAYLSGEMASAFDPAKVPNVSDAVVRAIALHDMGWMPVDGDVGSPRAPVALASGETRSFVNAEPETFLPAWLGSIQAAQSAGPLGGLLVSAHFRRLASHHLQRGGSGEQDTAGQRSKVEEFRQREAARAERLLPLTGLAAGEVEALVAVLQFCDLASLYLCANPGAPVECPQQLGGGRVAMRCEDGGYRMTPGLLARELALEIPCVRFAGGKPERESVPIRLR
jgi:hypothetical protein